MNAHMFSLTLSLLSVTKVFPALPWTPSWHSYNPASAGSHVLMGSIYYLKKAHVKHWQSQSHVITQMRNDLFLWAIILCLFSLFLSADTAVLITLSVWNRRCVLIDRSADSEQCPSWKWEPGNVYLKLTNQSSLTYTHACTLSAEHTTLYIS